MDFSYIENIKFYWGAALKLLMNRLDITNKEYTLIQLFKLIKEKLVEIKSALPDSYQIFKTFQHAVPAFKKRGKLKIIERIYQISQIFRYQ